MTKNILIFVLSSFVIGNVVAWFSGAAPIDFEQIEYSQSELNELKYLKAAVEHDNTDADAQLSLGQLYSYHNQIELAQPHLTRALELMPESSLAQAAYYANDGMLAGASIDPTMGIYKTIRLRTAMEKINDAANLADQDFSVRLIRLVTFSYVGEYGGLFDQIYIDEKWFNHLFDQSDGEIPEVIKQTAWIALANAYLNQMSNSTEQLHIGKQYFSRAMAIGPCPNTLQLSCTQLGSLEMVAGDL